MNKTIKSRVGVHSIEEHYCEHIAMYPYLADGHLIALEKSALFPHDAFFHWYLMNGEHGRLGGVMLKDLLCCPFCGEHLSPQTAVDDFDEPDEW